METEGSRIELDHLAVRPDASMLVSKSRKVHQLSVWQLGVCGLYIV